MKFGSWLRSDFARNILAAIVGAILCFLVPTRTWWHLYNLRMYLSYCLTFGLALGIAEWAGRDRGKPLAILAYLVILMMAFLATIWRGPLPVFVKQGGATDALHYLAFTVALAGIAAAWITAVLSVTRVFQTRTPRGAALFFEVTAILFPIAAIFFLRDPSDAAARAFVRLALLVATFSSARHFLSPRGETMGTAFNATLRPRMSGVFSRWKGVDMGRMIDYRPSTPVAVTLAAAILILAATGIYFALSAPGGISLGIPGLGTRTMPGQGPFGGAVEFTPSTTRFTPFARDMISWSIPWSFGGPAYGVRLYADGEVECLKFGIYEDAEGPVDARGKIPGPEAQAIFDRLREFDLGEFNGSYTALNVCDGALTEMTWSLDGWSGMIRSMNARVEPLDQAGKWLAPLAERIYREQNLPTPAERMAQSMRRFEEERRQAVDMVRDVSAFRANYVKADASGRIRLLQQFRMGMTRPAPPEAVDAILAIAGSESDPEARARAVGVAYNMFYLVDGEAKSRIRVFLEGVAAGPASPAADVARQFLEQKRKDEEMMRRLGSTP